MTGWEDLQLPEADPEVQTGFGIQVTWVDVSRHWAVWISRYYPKGNGKLESRDVYRGRFGLHECATGYQALMAALSDWRKSS